MTAATLERILVYADGSCEGNPGPGGWGVVIVGPAETRRLNGGDPRTTNNRMELTAAIEALCALDPGCAITLRSDSQYLVRTMNDGWRRTKNRDLWERLDAEVARRDVRFEWVRGHAGDRLNEEADELARIAARGAAQGRAPHRMDVPSGADARRSPTPAVDHEADRLIAGQLAPALQSGERIAPCAACARLFVARGDEQYCSLIGCQARRRR